MIRIALIGYGYAARTFHAPLIRATPDLELAVISSSRPERVHADLPGMPVVSSPEEACALSSVELVVIATPNDTHVPIATAALRAGKHVVVEKPLAPTLADARALASLAQRRNRMLAVFQNRRWDGDFLALTELVTRAAVGDLAHVESHFDRYRPIVRDRWRERAGMGSGLWYDLGPHLVDQALQLFGVPDRVIASMAVQRTGGQSNDWAHVVLEYSRLRVILHTSMLAAAPLPRFIAHGQTGSWIKYGLDSQERQLNAAFSTEAAGEVQDAERAVLVDGASGIETVTAVPDGDYRQFYVRIRNALQGAGRNPVPPEQAVPVIAVMEAAIQSADQGRALSVPLTTEERRAFSR
ncbi:MAG TPA: oxidoreductase [Vicinamibacterales bacterium]|nr:oxidoreductase [Vicinamibacterales bacterium]